MGQRLGSIVIENVEPELEGGRYAVKRVAGENLTLSADIFKEGHDFLSAVARLRQVAPPRLDHGSHQSIETTMREINNDRWTAQVSLPSEGLYAFTVEAWVDVYRTWAAELQRKAQACQPIFSELREGAALLLELAGRAQPRSASDALTFSNASRMIGGSLDESLPSALDSAVRAATSSALIELATLYPDRSSAVRYQRELPVFVDREKARFSSWYEMFPRSASRSEKRHGTFKDCESWLRDISEMGFDTLYFPPIHPIGKTARKGKNNSVVALSDDVGSPWAIGSAEGGHKSIHPQLGTMEDFKHLIGEAKSVNLEVALDLAFQCAPDHPYLTEHPEWFYKRPDGTIKTAENPPKRYEDIVNFDFLGPARQSLWPELKSVVLFWIEVGIKIFRVDNPHTKPVQFWEWLIREIQVTHPDVIFLAEAFTRPKMMKALGKAGFSQSYTYFTWRNFKGELTDYLNELSHGPVAQYMRGNLWPNTPDILPQILQQGGTPAFKLRFALAATLSPSYGIYCGFEFCENRALPGTEEYVNSEKYQLVEWPGDRKADIRDYISAINQIRQLHPALRLSENLTFCDSDSERVLVYSKVDSDKTDKLLIAVSLDPYAPQEAIINLPLGDYGIEEHETYQVHELLSDTRSLWKGPTAQIRLTPESPAAIWSVLRLNRSEQSFDYYD